MRSNREKYLALLELEEGMTPFEKLLRRTKMSKHEFIVAADIGHATATRLFTLESAAIPAKVKSFLEKIGEDADFFEHFYKVNREAYQIELTRKAKSNLAGFEAVKKNAVSCAAINQSEAI